MPSGISFSPAIAEPHFPLWLGAAERATVQCAPLILSMGASWPRNGRTRFHQLRPIPWLQRLRIRRDRASDAAILFDHQRTATIEADRQRTDPSDGFTRVAADRAGDLSHRCGVDR